MERDVLSLVLPPVAPLIMLPPTPLLPEAGPNSSDIVHTKIRRQHPNSKPEIEKQEIFMSRHAHKNTLSQNVIKK